MSPLPVRMGQITRAASLRLVVDGEEIEAFEGESIATALLADGRVAWRRSPHLGEPRGLYCGIGTCFECLVEVEGQGTARACQTPVRPGMRLRTAGVGAPGGRP